MHGAMMYLHIGHPVSWTHSLLVNFSRQFALLGVSSDHQYSRHYTILRNQQTSTLYIVHCSCNSARVLFSNTVVNCYHIGSIITCGTDGTFYFLSGNGSQYGRVEVYVRGGGVDTCTKQDSGI